MEPENIGGKKFRTAFVIILVVAVSALFLAVTWPFLKALLLVALLAGLFHPVLPVDYATPSRSAIAGRDRNVGDSLYRRGRAIERISRSGRATGAGRK